MVVVGFAAAIAVGTLLLLVPSARRPGSDATWVDALFTATSAVTVTGLVTEYPGTTWSGDGQAVLLLLIQLGGLGMVTSGTLLIGVQRAGGSEFEAVGAGTVVQPGDRIVVAGRASSVERFARER